MKFYDLYKLKSEHKDFELKAKDFDLALKGFDGSDIEGVYVFLLLDPNVKDSVLNRVKTFVLNLPKSVKKKVYSKLADFPEKLNVEVFLTVISGEDLDFLHSLFVNILKSNQCECVDQFMLFERVLSVSGDQNNLDEYTSLIIKIADRVLSDELSLKGEVRMAVSVLRKIGELLPLYSSTLNLISEKYTNNSIWKTLVDEEIRHRHSVLSSSFSKKVAEAFKNKEFLKVVNMIGRYENELPATLKKKLDISRKKINKL